MLPELGSCWYRCGYQVRPVTLPHLKYSLIHGSHLEIYSSAIAIREFRDYRKMRHGMPLSSVMSGQTDEEEMVQRFPPQPETAYQGHREARHTAPSRYHAQVVRSKQ